MVREFLHSSVNYPVLVGITISFIPGAYTLGSTGGGDGLRGSWVPSVLTSAPIVCYNLNFGQEVEQLPPGFCIETYAGGSPAPQNSRRIPEIIPCLDRTEHNKQKMCVGREGGERSEV